MPECCVSLHRLPVFFCAAVLWKVQLAVIEGMMLSHSYGCWGIRWERKVGERRGRGGEKPIKVGQEERSVGQMGRVPAIPTFRRLFPGKKLTSSAQWPLGLCLILEFVGLKIQETSSSLSSVDTDFFSSFQSNAFIKPLALVNKRMYVPMSPVVQVQPWFAITPSLKSREGA